MKEILVRYLKSEIRMKDSETSQYHFYPLVGVSDTYFTVDNPFDGKNEINRRYIPYTSVSQIIEQDCHITVELISDKLEEEIKTIYEEIGHVKGCIIGNSVPLGEIMRKLNILDENELKERQNSLNSIERDVSKLANSTRFYR